MYLFKPGEMINKRYLVKDIKEGGLGIVFLCYDNFIGMPIALKTFKFEPTNEWKLALSNFLHEAKIWINIGSDMHIVQAYYIVNFETKDNIIPLIAIELIEGHEIYGNSLRSFIQISSFNLELVLNIAIAICNGMISIRKKLSTTDFVHRDLKPENILITRGGSIKITDFGISKVIIENSSKLPSLKQSVIQKSSYTFGLTENICGTPPYMSPEQCLGTKFIDERSDVYSFGCILFELCTKHFIFEAKSSIDFVRKHISEKPPLVQSINTDVPISLSNLIQQCLSKNVDNRPHNFQQLRDSLIKLLNSNYGSGSGVRFWLCGFSGLTDKPRVKSNFNMSKKNEALLWGKSLSVQYAIDQGLINNKEEFDKLDEAYEQHKEDERKETELLIKKEKVDEYVLSGDSLLRLSEVAEIDEAIGLIRASLTKYYFAQELLPLEVEINFRIGMANFLLAGLLKENNNPLSNDLIKLAIDELSSVLRENMKPKLVSIGSTFYLLPHHALFWRAGTYMLVNDKTSALKDFNTLLSMLNDPILLEKYPGIASEIRRVANEGIQKTNENWNGFI